MGGLSPWVDKQSNHAERRACGLFWGWGERRRASGLSVSSWVEKRKQGRRVGWEELDTMLREHSSRGGVVHRGRLESMGRKAKAREEGWLVGMLRKHSSVREGGRLVA